jgi:glycosyltransferase involved in cell wall biosynthesis
VTVPDRPVLQLLGPSTGGIRRHVTALTAALRERAWPVETAGPRGVLDGVGDGPDHVVSVPSGVSIVDAIRATRDLQRLTGSVALVHAHGLTAGWVASLVPRRPPLVVTVHNLVLGEAPTARLLRRLERALPGRADAIIAVSPEIGRHFALRRGVHVVRPLGPPPRPRRAPAEVREALGVGPDAPLVVCVARLHPQKGLPTLVVAAERLARARPEVRVAIVGEGPDEAELRALVAGRGLNDIVLLAGPSTNAADELRAADVVVCSSIWESGPLVVAEALTLGRPVVSTPVGFAPDVLTGKVGAALVPVGDAEAMAAAVLEALDDREAAATAAAEAGERVADLLGHDRLVAGVEDVYQEVLEP